MENDNGYNPSEEESGFRPNRWLKLNYEIYDHLTNGLLAVKHEARNPRRLLLAEAFQRGGFPIELSLSEAGRKRAHQLKADGYAFLAPYNHERFRDPIDATHAIIALGGDFVDADFSAPVAHHQNKPYINALTHMLDMDTAFLVTESTIRKNENYEKPGIGDHAREIFSRAKHHLNGEEFIVPERKELPLHFGMYESRELSVDTLRHQGVVIIAPSAERRPELGPQNKRPIEMIVREAQRVGVDKIAFLPMGLVLDPRSIPPQENDDAQEEPQEDSSGLHRKEKVVVEIIEPFTLDELKKRAAAKGINMDQQLFVELEDRIGSARQRLAA